jgi:hypothetical protein
MDQLTETLEEVVFYLNLCVCRRLQGLSKGPLLRLWKPPRAEPQAKPKKKV